MCQAVFLCLSMVSDYKVVTDRVATPGRYLFFRRTKVLVVDALASLNDVHGMGRCGLEVVVQIDVKHL